MFKDRIRENEEGEAFQKVTAAIPNFEWLPILYRDLISFVAIGEQIVVHQMFCHPTWKYFIYCTPQMFHLLHTSHVPHI